MTRDYAVLHEEISATNIQLHRLHDWLEETRRLAGQSWGEREKNPALEDMTSIYQARIELLTQEIAQCAKRLISLTEQLPCQALIDVTNVEFHDFYRAQHLIDRHTRVFKDFCGKPVIDYELPVVPIVEFTPDASIPTRIGEARFNRFAYTVNGQTILYEIAFAPEINTLWYRISYL